LRRLPRQQNANVLVGFDTSDDAGVYQLSPELALVQTVDFFTPIVDDPFLYGAIAAANSLSDVYAMGGRPVSALSIVGFPPQGQPDLMEQILRGGLSKMEEAGCAVVGGHSIRDEELKFGYAVTGVIDPRRVWRNVGAQPGDALLLTKPLGTGVIATALKQGKAAEASVAAAMASMARLNREATEGLKEVEEVEEVKDVKEVEDSEGARGSAAKGFSSTSSTSSTSWVHAVTDVTGFGLLGHAREMALGAFVPPASSPQESKRDAAQAPAAQRNSVSLEIDHRAVEYLPGAVEAARAGFLAGGLKNNRDFIEGCVEFASGVAEEYRALLFDPQTSGGLLVAIAAQAADAAVAALARRNVAARRIGRVLPKTSPLIAVR